MLKQCYRLKKNSAFTATYKARNIISDQFFVIYLGRKKNDEDLFTKVGFVVSKKFHKRAVKRNKIKRLMRESYRLLQKDFLLDPFNNYLSLIIVPKTNALGLDINVVKNSLTTLAAKASFKD